MGRLVIERGRIRGHCLRARGNLRLRFQRGEAVFFRKPVMGGSLQEWAKEKRELPFYYGQGEVRPKQGTGE